MARGWESKSIESQQEEAARERSHKPALTPEQRARAERRRALELARARAAADRDRATSDRHKSMLTQAIEALDQQLSSLE
jgi:hypothetical protein